MFECDKATKVAKRLVKWTQRRAEEEAKHKKREAELLKDSGEVRPLPLLNLCSPCSCFFGIHC